MVSIIIPYNEDRGFLGQAMRSAHLAAGVGDHVIVQHGVGKSFAQNFNQALDKVVTPYVCFLAEDDMLTRDSITARVNAMANNDYDFVCANATIFGDHIEDIHYISRVPRNAQVLAEHNSIHGGTVMYRTDALRAVGGMDETLITGEEWELNMRLLKAGYHLGYVNATVYLNRLHLAQKSGGGVIQPQHFADIKARKAYLRRIADNYR